MHWAVSQAVAVALHNPEGFRTFGQARLDVGRVLPERMSDESYRELLVCVHPAVLLVLLCWLVFIRISPMLTAPASIMSVAK